MSREAPKTNRDRTAATRAALIDAGRRLFVEHGYAETSTPEVVRTAGVTRGALYHHFADKRELFLAVVEDEAKKVGEAIADSSPPSGDPRADLIAGCGAYLDAMAVPGRTRLMLIEGPSVLGAGRVREMDEAHAAGELRQGLAAAVPADSRGRFEMDALGDLLSAVFDRAAIAIDGGAGRTGYEATIIELIDRVIDRAHRPA
ncbi:MAG TPA: helix-turn-helix domain-containing protein [Solirubrobacterales bacterium]|nr:helix-turn-helix domain-containing protein [Solirubrobacterales bacterium]